MDARRMQKLESLIKEITSKLIIEEMTEEQEKFGIITITGVKIAPDLSYADILISSIKNQDTLAHDIARHGYTIQKILNKTLSLVKLPKVRFRYDNSGEKASNIGMIIDNLYN